MLRLLDATGRLFTLLAIVVAVAGLYVARNVLIPLALAILLSFLLAPVVRQIERLRLWRVPAVLLVSGLAFAFVMVIGYVLAVQGVGQANRLPQYRNAIHQRIASLRQSAGGIYGRVTRNIQDISKELSTQAASQPTPPAASSSAPAASPVPVQLVEGVSSPLPIALAAMGLLLNPLLTACLVILFVLFILVQREDLRDRLIRLVGQDHLDVTTQAFDDVAQRISRYLLAQAAINTSYGLIVALSLYFLGLPNAFLWGFMMAALRFIPYIGVWIGMLIPVALSLAIWPEGWGRPVAVAGIVVGLEILTANLIEPLLYANGTGITPLAVLLAAVFWGWLWGPVGLLLSTPLTVCLAVMGKYVPALSFLEVLLTDEPVLDPPVRFYQRLLAGDKEEAQDLAETSLEGASLPAVYDQVLIPALRLLELDRHRGQLDEARAEIVVEAIEETIDFLVSRDRELRRRSSAEPATVAQIAKRAIDATAQDPRGAPVLCLPAGECAEQLVSMMLAQVLTLAGMWARSVPANMLISEMLEAVEGSRAGIVCISALPRGRMDKVVHLCKRLKGRFPAVRVVVELSIGGDAARLHGRLSAAGADHIASNLSTVLRIVRPSQTPAMQTDAEGKKAAR